MPFNDLREFLSLVQERGELRTVDEADWDIEIGTICELNYEREGPALMFDHINGYPAGYRVVTNLLETLPRALLALDIDPTLDLDSALDEYERKLSSQQPIPPVEVQEGPILENVFTGDDVNLLKLPTPRWHEGDGGRYLGTGSLVIQRDPDSGEVNCGTYRLMVHDEKTLGLWIGWSQDGARIERKYWDRGQSCPVAVSFGHDPLLFVVGTAYLGKWGLGEYGFAGHLRGKPVEVIREEITGLPIPATAEIVVAGEIPPPKVESRDEGPFGEWTGYYASRMSPQPVIKVRALYHRNHPIILGMPPVKFRGPVSHFGLPSQGRTYKEELKRKGIEDVIDVWRAAVPGVTVVQIRQRYPGHAMKAGLALAGEYVTRFIVVVDEDINPRDPNDVLWAIGTRCDPATTLSIIPGCKSTPLDPRITPEQRARGDYTYSCAIIDACKPYHWKDEFPPTNVASPELRREVLTKWKELF